ncbi:MAG: Smr/MutS family protein [Maritimibacter sp.]
MSRRKPRGLRPDEKELWSKVVEQASRLNPERPAETSQKALSRPKTPQVKTPHFHIGARSKRPDAAHDLAPSLRDTMSASPVSMDKKRFGQMKKGRLSPEARLDLHGLTLAQAHPRLLNFIFNSVRDGKRLVLVITGKGKSKPSHGPIPERLGVLRHQVPHWLNSPPLRAHVLQISEAHLKHGGHGAYYVYLRRAK